MRIKDLTICAVPTTEPDSKCSINVVFNYKPSFMEFRSSHATKYRLSFSLVREQIEVQPCEGTFLREHGF